MFDFLVVSISCDYHQLGFIWWARGCLLGGTDLSVALISLSLGEWEGLRSDSHDSDVHHTKSIVLISQPPHLPNLLVSKDFSRF